MASRTMEVTVSGDSFTNNSGESLGHTNDRQEHVTIGEIPKIVSRKASETPGNPDSEGIYWGNPKELSEREGAVSAQSGRISEDSAQANIDVLWRRMDGMEEQIRVQTHSQAEMLANILQSIQRIQGQDTISSENEPAATSALSSSGADDLDAFFSPSPSDREKKEDDDYLEDLRKLYEDEEQYGPNLDENLASIVNNAIEKPIPDDQMKQLCAKYLVPENCKKITVPKINRELWKALKDNRSSDLALQSSQKAISSAMVPVIKSMEIIKNKGDVNEVKHLIKDTFRLLAHGLNTTNRKRKALIRPNVPEKYRKVCENESVSSSEFLFGDDLDQRVDAIEKEERRVQKLSGKTFNRGPFLGRNFPKGKDTRFQNHKNQRSLKQQYFQGKSQSHRGRFGKH